MTSTVVQKLLLFFSICLIIFGFGLTVSGVFSPAWQVVDIREFRAEHQHGLWWDCIRAEKHVVAVGDFYDETKLHCMYKFDQSAELVIENTLNNVDQDGAAGESEHHRFWAWHKAILFFIIFSQILAFTSVCTGICAPCFHPMAFVFTISLFIALISSLIADGVFFLAANRVDNRFVQGMVGTYEQRIGYAFYLHISGTLCWLFAFICAIATTYKFFTSNGSRKLFESNNNYLRPELSHVKMEWNPSSSAAVHHYNHNRNSSNSGVNTSAFSANLSGIRFGSNTRRSSTQNSLNDGYSSQHDPLLQSKRPMLSSPVHSTAPFYTPTINKQAPYLRSALVNSSNRQSPIASTTRVYRETSA